MNLQNDLFLLMFTLSQMKEKGGIMKLFLESLNELFKPNKFFFSENNPEKTLYFEEIIFGDNSYGYLLSKEMPSKEIIKSIQNSVQMLALILDRLRMDQELKNKARTMETVAKQRLEAIKANVEELENTRRESLTLIENLKREITRREKIEKELRLSEEKFRLSFHTTPDAVNINRLEDGLYIEVNQGFTDITGYTEDEVVGKTSYEINIWNDFKDRERLVQGLKKDGKYYNLEAKFKTKSGRLIDGLMSASLINLDNVPHLINITRDISEIKKTQERLQKSELLFRKAFENSTSGMCLTSLKGEILRVNNKLCEILGYSSEELLGSSFPEITLPEDIPMGRENIEKALDGKIDFIDMEKRYIRKDRKTIWARVSSSLIRDAENKPLYFISHITDISEKKKIAEIIKKERDQAQKYLDIAGVMLASINKNGNIVIINKKGCEILGYDSALELVGKNWLDLFLPEKNREEIKNVFSEHMSGNAKVFEYYENPVVTKSGEERIIGFNNTVLIDEKGKATGVLFSGEDITERVKAENEIKKLNSDLEKRVEERTAELENANQELEELNDVFVGREMRIIELKEEVARLKNKLKEK